jgi:hypothetical protein
MNWADDMVTYEDWRWRRPGSAEAEWAAEKRSAVDCEYCVAGYPQVLTETDYSLKVLHMHRFRLSRGGGA